MFEDDADFEYETQLRIRIRDLDHMEHINNAVYATYMEQARVDYLDDVLGINLDELQMAVVSSHIEFKKQVRYGGYMTVQTRVPELGETSFPLEYRFLDEDDVAATARTIQVVLDSDGEAARPVPDSWRDGIIEYEGLAKERET
ncbi:MAG: thioesterase family protein [Natronomonas sp.]